MSIKLWCSLVITLATFSLIGCVHRETAPKNSAGRKESLKVVSVVDPMKGIETLDYTEPGLSVHATREFKDDLFQGEYRCTAMTISVNGTEIAIPYSSYSWAFVFNSEYPSLDLDRDKTGLFLEFSGGDGAGTHHITYWIANSRLRQICTVKNGIRPVGKDGQLIVVPIAQTVDFPD